MGWLSAICPLSGAMQPFYTTRGGAASTLDGFCPQSELVQRGVLYAAFGVRETMVFVKNRREAVFPKVDARFRGRGLMAPPGLWPWAPRVLPVIG